MYHAVRKPMLSAFLCALATWAIGGAAEAAGDGKPLPGAQAAASPEEWSKHLRDVLRQTQNGQPPAALIEWMETLEEPRSMTALATVTLEPKDVSRLQDLAPNPRNVMNWSEFSDPARYLRWMLGRLNPGVFPAINSQPAIAGSLAKQGATEAKLEIHDCLSALGTAMTATRPTDTSGSWWTLPQPVVRQTLPPGRTYRY